MEWWNRYLKTRSDAEDASYDMKEQTIPQMWDVINKPILQGLPVTNGVDPDYWKRNLGAVDAARYSGHPLAAMSILDPNLAGETAKAAAGFLPVVGAAVDAYDMSTDKSQRTPLNMGLGMLGAAGDVAKPALGAMAFAGTFAGRKAKTADLDALKEAEKLTAEGETPYMVWLKTKWFQGADSKWRFEIDDSSANHVPKMNTFDHADQISREETGKGVRDLGMNDPRRPNIFERARVLSDAESTNLGSRLDHPALYEAYPELSDYPAKTMIVEGSHSGSFSPHTKKVEAIGSDNDEVTSILMHEAAGHGVQDIEGFASGGSPEMIKKVQGQARARMRSLKNGLEDLKRAKTQYPVGSDQYKEATELEQQVTDAIANTKRAGYVGLDPSSSYDRLAGEVEARQVQGRLDMSQKRRDASFPMQGSQIWDHATMDYPPEEQLLRFDSKAIRNDPTILDRDDVYRSTKAPDDKPMGILKSQLDDAGVLKMDDASKAARAEEQGFRRDVYHGTTHPDITEFDMDKANVESHWGTGAYTTTTYDDASQNYSTRRGGDLNMRIDLEAERLENNGMSEAAAKKAAEEKYFGGGSAVKEIKVKTQNPFELGVDADGYETKLDYTMPERDDPANFIDEAKKTINPDDYEGNANLDDEDYLEDVREKAEELADEDWNYRAETEGHSGDLVDFIYALNRSDADIDEHTFADLIMRLEDAGDMDAGISASELDDIMRNTEWYATDDDGNLVNSEVYRQALEDIGFDSIVDRNANEKFGAGKKLRNGILISNGMDGLDETTEHVILFKPNQLRNKDAEFHPDKTESNDLRSGIMDMKKGGVLSYA